MRDSYLEVTYRLGRAIAAYYYLPLSTGRKSHRTEEFAPDVLVDYSRSGKPIGIEILAPQKMSVARMNRILRELGLPGLERGELAPLRTA